MRQFAAVRSSGYPICGRECRYCSSLLLLVVGGLASSVALVCALVGLVKFRQYRVANICLAVISVVANPLVLLGLYMAAY